MNVYWIDHGRRYIDRVLFLSRNLAIDRLNHLFSDADKNHMIVAVQLEDIEKENSFPDRVYAWFDYSEHSFRRVSVNPKSEMSAHVGEWWHLCASIDPARKGLLTRALKTASGKMVRG